MASPQLREPRGEPSVARDIRSAKPYLLTRNPVRTLLRRVLSISSLVALDVAGIVLGLYVALGLRELWVGHVPPLWGILWRAETDWLPFLTLVTALVFWQRGLYASRERRADLGRILPSLVLAALLVFAFAVGSGHDFVTYGLVPTAVLTIAVFIGLFRWSYQSLTASVFRLRGVRRLALLVGHGSGVDHVWDALGSAPDGIPYEFVGSLGPSGGNSVPHLGDLEDVSRVLRTVSLDELVVADAELAEEKLLELVERAHRRGVKVRVAPRTTGLISERAHYLPGQGVPLFELRPPVFLGTDWAVKRTFDTAVSLLVIGAGLPLWLAIAAAVKLSSPGPVFFRDRRIGVGEREFSMLKFRTMYVDAPGRQAEYEHANQAEGALFKLRADPRVTPLGAVLRRLSLDEIPQVLNVLKREMSLVGPRPLPLRDYQRLEGWHRKRYLILPGMTGLWQISGRSNLGSDDLVRLDFYYLDNWSIWLDVSIVLRTIPAVLSGRGAY